MELSRREDGPSSALPAPPVALGNNVFLFEPSVAKPADALTNSDSSSSECSPPPRIAKYIEGYRKAYPGATLVLIRTVIADIAVRSFAAVRSRLEPARDAIIKALRQQQRQQKQRRRPRNALPVPARALLHIFSNGGCNTAIQLAHAISDAAGTLLRDHLRQIVFDCCPGGTSFDKAFNAAAVSLPPAITAASAPVRAVGTAAVFATVAAITALQRPGLMSSFNDMQRQLNEPALFGSAARRLYLISRADDMVDPAVVRAHARLAREARCEVGLVLFREAPHCALVTEDADRYWSVIHDCWMGVPLPQLDGQSKL